MVASVKMPATWPFRTVLTFSAWDTCCGVERRRGALRFWRASSSGSFFNVPLPKMTRPGLALYSKESMVVVVVMVMVGVVDEGKR